MARNVFLDTNVILDYLFDRKPYSGFAGEIIALSESGDLTLFISAISINNIYYIARKSIGHEKSLDVIRDILEMVEILDLNKDTIIYALDSGFRDFEDGIQYCTAFLKNDMQVILTQNIKDFTKSNLPVMTPEKFLISRAK